MPCRLAIRGTPPASSMLRYPSIPTNAVVAYRADWAIITASCPGVKWCKLCAITTISNSPISNSVISNALSNRKLTASFFFEAIPFPSSIKAGTISEAVMRTSRFFCSAVSASAKARPPAPLASSSTLTSLLVRSATSVINGRRVSIYLG